MKNINRQQERVTGSQLTLFLAAHARHKFMTISLQLTVHTSMSMASVQVFAQERKYMRKYLRKYMHKCISAQVPAQVREYASTYTAQVLAQLS